MATDRGFFMEFLDSTFSALNKLDQRIKEADEIRKSRDAKKNDDDPVMLTEQELSQMKWMSASQLDAIFGHGRKPVKLQPGPGIYRQLKWMNDDQLEAIFGKGGMDDE